MPAGQALTTIIAFGLRFLISWILSSSFSMPPKITSGSPNSVDSKFGAIETGNSAPRSNSPRRPVELTVVHAAVTRRSLHFPEICLVGEGWDVRDQGIQPVGVTFAAKRLVLVRGTESEAVIYWFQTGAKLTPNYFVNAWHWARDQICFRSPVSAMVRLSTPIGNQGETTAFSVLVDFAMKLAPLMQDCGAPRGSAMDHHAAIQRTEARTI
jgi:EpsI family protein